MTLVVTDRFGAFGGHCVPESLIPALDQLEVALADALADPEFEQELLYLLETYAGRPSPLPDAPTFSARLGVPVWLKREDLNHTGAHKINNALKASHAIAWLAQQAGTFAADDAILRCVNGRGDNDVNQAASLFEGQSEFHT